MCFSLLLSFFFHFKMFPCSSLSKWLSQPQQIIFMFVHFSFHNFTSIRFRLLCDVFSVLTNERLTFYPNDYDDNFRENGTLIWAWATLWHIHNDDGCDAYLPSGSFQLEYHIDMICMELNFELWIVDCRLWLWALLWSWIAWIGTIHVDVMLRDTMMTTTATTTNDNEAWLDSVIQWWNLYAETAPHLTHRLCYSYGPYQKW